ncbi:MAG: hypothetical protein AB1416_07815, partial [Actinomycetota bacterium]
MVTSRVRRGAGAAFLAGVLAAAAAGSARADMGGGVATLGGTPLGGAVVTLSDATAATVATTTADASGRYAFASAVLAGKTGPFTVRAQVTDACRVAPEVPQRTASAGGLSDGAVQNLSLDVTELCGAAPAGLPVPTGYVDSASRSVLAGPGATAYLRVPVPAEATGVEVRLSTGAVVSQTPPSAGVVPIVAPTAPYSGPLVLRYAVGGSVVERALGQMTSGVVAKPAPRRTLDVVAAVPLGGVTTRPGGANDAQDWIALLARLSRPADGFGAFGFDTIARPVADVAPLRGATGVGLVEDVARATLVDTSGLNDPNVAFAQARRMLTAPGADASRRKLVVFPWTGLGAATAYLGGHLRLGFNDTGTAWPVCAIQVGGAVSVADTARLRRIALDSGGAFLLAAAPADVADAILECRAAAAGESTVLATRVALRPKPRAFEVKVPAKRAVTVLLSRGSVATASLSLVDPQGRTRTSASPGRGVSLVQTDTFTLATIAAGSRAGTWTVRVGVRR